MRSLDRPNFEANWWPLALETLPGSGEQITIAVVARARSGQSQIRQSVSPAALTAMFGTARQGMAILIGETVHSIQRQLDDGVSVESIDSPFEGITLGEAREAVAQDLNEIFDLAFRMSSAFSYSQFGVATPNAPSREVIAAFEEWASKIRNEVALRSTSPSVISSFNVSLKVQGRKSIRVGFLHAGFAANFGVLRPGHRASADTNALKVKLFDLEQLKRDRTLVTQDAALLVGVLNADQAAIFPAGEMRLLRDSLDYVQNEARARGIEFQQFDSPVKAADRLRKVYAGRQVG